MRKVTNNKQIKLKLKDLTRVQKVLKSYKLSLTDKKLNRMEDKSMKCPVMRKRRQFALK